MSTDGWATRDHLLDVAGGVLRDVGAARFSLREVARRADVSPAAVYRHFADREALLDVVTRIGSQRLLLHLLAATSQKTPRARLEASAAALLHFALERPAQFRAGFDGASAREALHLLADRVRECMDTRVLRRGDPQAVATALWALGYGLVTMRLAGQLDELGGDEQFARFYRQSVDRVLSAYAK
jgi:AcrR family transcriptional regulator